MSLSESWLRLLLRFPGWIRLLALSGLFAPRSWLEAGHRLLGLGDVPTAPIAEYLARSVSALCAFYGGLLLLLARDVRRFASIIRYQAVAIMALSVAGIFAGVRAGVPPFSVVADALGCWVSYQGSGGAFEVLVDASGQVVGSVGVFPVSPSTCELRKMYLVPSARGLGFGLSNSTMKLLRMITGQRQPTAPTLRNGDCETKISGAWASGTQHGVDYLSPNRLRGPKEQLLE